MELVEVKLHYFMRFVKLWRTMLVTPPPPPSFDLASPFVIFIFVIFMIRDINHSGVSTFGKFINREIDFVRETPIRENDIRGIEIRGIDFRGIEIRGNHIREIEFVIFIGYLIDCKHFNQYSVLA